MLTTLLHYPDKLLRSTGFPAAIAVVALVIGVPLFLRMPPWCDLTLYDVAARTVIAGGTMYRDVFDTNLPGFVWCLIGIRRACGTSLEAVRTVDLAIVAAIAVLLMRFLRAGGADRASLAWFAASMALFYPFTTEFSHAQRDVWMTLPMLLAVGLRVRNIERAAQFTGNILFRASALEGVWWAIAVWFKPHVLLVAAVMWLVTLPARRQRTPFDHAWRVDLFGNLAGGTVIALLGIAALLLTGTWSHLTDVLFKWNASYLATVWSETWVMFGRVLNIFAPWSLLNLVGVPLAIFMIVRMYRNDFEVRRFRTGVLAAFYLAVLAQSCGLQRNFDYVHVPETMLLLALIAMALPRLLALYTLGMLAMSLVWPQVFEHAIADDRRLVMWKHCFRECDAVEYRGRQWRLALQPEYCSTPNVVELGEIADWLKKQRIGEGDVVAYHDTPHAVYLDLGLKPTFRFMHIMVTYISSDNIWRGRRELLAVLPRTKYVVSDMMHPMRYGPFDVWERRHETGPDLLPPAFPPRLRQTFPYDQPAVFRSGGGKGRYIVHRVTNPEPQKFENDWDVWAK